MTTAGASQVRGKAPEVAAPARQRLRNRNAAFEAVLGARIRAARIAADLSQSALGEAVGVSFQQIQKYELGRDRVSASTLLDIAAAVGVHPGWFYGADTPTPPGGIPEVRAAWRLVQGMRRLENPAIVNRIMALVDEIAGPESAGPAAG